jgi:hypothetical protein
MMPRCAIVALRFIATCALIYFLMFVSGLCSLMGLQGRPEGFAATIHSISVPIFLFLTFPLQWLPAQSTDALPVVMHLIPVFWALLIWMLVWLAAYGVGKLRAKA